MPGSTIPNDFVHSQSVWVRFVAAGYHRWPDALLKRAYLAERHRHLFHVKVSVDVNELDRQIEFHDLLDMAKEHFPDEWDHGAKSCEMMALDLGRVVLERTKARNVAVDVSEDGECGARVEVWNALRIPDYEV